MKKKILHVINSMTAGGAETLLANSLSPGGLQEYTDNIVVYFQGSSHLTNIIDKEVEIHCLAYKGILSLPATLRKLRRMIKEHKIDIVHTHLCPASFYTHLAIPGNVPQVHTMHTTYSMDTEARPIMRYLERNLYLKKKDCKLILLSDFTKADFLETVSFKGKTFVLNNFVPDSFFENPVKKYDPPQPRLKLIAAGTLKELKNFEYLLEVFKHLKNEEVYLDIFGGGNKTKYEQEINTHGLKVRMMGYRENLESVFPDYDVFVLPSKFEGFPLVVFEAMASGVPLLLSNILPVKSIVNEHATYFDLDNAEATAGIIKQILNKEIDISAMAAKAKTYADQLVRRETYLKGLLAIYEQVTTS